MNKTLIRDGETGLPAFWLSGGSATAKRNLWISIPALWLAYAVWMLWSAVVVRLPDIGFRYSANQLFLLAAVPGLSGATLRIFYAFMVPLFGGRRWTVLSTASLLLPALGLGLAVQDRSTSFPAMLVLALLCGLGGGNFASSMANIGFLFPKAHRQDAIGINAALGKLGIALAQSVLPFAISMPLFGAWSGGPQIVPGASGTRLLWLQNAGFIWVPFIVVSIFLAWRGMNDTAAGELCFAQQAVIFKRKHNWLMCLLHLGTQGSFIGYAAGFPLLLQTQFPAVDSFRFAFLGPLAGALACLVGDRLARSAGGTRITLYAFMAMSAAIAGVMLFLHGDGSSAEFAGFFAMFLLLFVSTGIGSGASLRMTAEVFVADRVRATAGQDAAAQAQAIADANEEASSSLAFSSAIAACGAFFIPKSYGSAIAFNGSPMFALYFFFGFYLICVAMTWRCFLRKPADASSR